MEVIKSCLPYIAVVAASLYVVKLGMMKWNQRLIRTTSFPNILFSLASTGGFFTSFLNIHNCIVDKVKLYKGSFGFSYLIPRHLSTSGGVLDLGGVLALADEVSTVLLCCDDKTHRAGVSVSLSGEILRPEELKAGNKVWVESVISKVGVALGFVEVLIWKGEDKNDLLARVSHIKYMQTGGVVWDVLSPLMPTLVLMAHRFGWGGAALSPEEYLPLPKLLDVQPSTDEKSDFELHSHRNIQNHFKFLHGGALSMAITDAITQYHTTSQQKTGGKAVCPTSLRWMEMQYLSPCKGKISISIVPQPSTKLGGALPPNDSLEHIHSFRVEIYAAPSVTKHHKGESQKRRCLAHGSVLFY